jgi:sulfite exporter TauE/SafE/copper chaperone CopZ
MKKHIYYIKGMHCRSCEILIEKNIAEIPGVKKVEVSYKKGIAVVESAGESLSNETIAKAVNEAGYSLGRATKLPWLTTDSRDYREIFLGFAALALIYVFGKGTGILDAFSGGFSAAPTYPIVFLIGLTAGVSTCMAVVGGLVAGFSAAYAESHQYATRWQRFRPNLSFNLGRLVSYALLGGVIGAFGSVVKISAGFTGFLIVGAGVVMFYMGLKLTGISPRIANAGLTIPKKIGRALGMSEADGEYSHGGTFVAGALTFFLPCGFTQAMQLYAITTGSFATGALVMFLFALGTTPGLLSIGAITSVLQGRKAITFFRFVGVVLVVLGFMNIAHGAALGGWNLQLPSFGAGQGAPSQAAIIENGEQVVTMAQLANGYQPNSFTVQKGMPVKWVIDSKSAFTCAASIRMPAMNIGQVLQAGENVIRFTPTQTGSLRFTCGMGMYSGNFTVVD